MGITACFKLHIAINGSEQKRQGIPQRQQEIAVLFSSAASLDLKAFTLQTKRNSRLKNVISGCSVPVTSTARRRPHLVTDRQGRAALSRLSASLRLLARNPCALNPVTPQQLNLQRWRKHGNAHKPGRMGSKGDELTFLKTVL